MKLRMQYVLNILSQNFVLVHFTFNSDLYIQKVYYSLTIGFKNKYSNFRQSDPLLKKKHVHLKLLYYHKIRIKNSPLTPIQKIGEECKPGDR